MVPWNRRKGVACHDVSLDALALALLLRVYETIYISISGILFIMRDSAVLHSYFNWLVYYQILLLTCELVAEESRRSLWCHRKYVGLVKE